jgi:hypothetical protein
MILVIIVHIIDDEGDRANLILLIRLKSIQSLEFNLIAKRKQELIIKKSSSVFWNIRGTNFQNSTICF